MLKFIRNNWINILIISLLLYTLFRLDVFGANWETIEASPDAPQSLQTQVWLESRQVPYLLQNLKEYAKSQCEKYSISWYQLEKTIQCESNWQHDGVWGKAGEYGLAQFMPDTFQRYCQGDWKNAYAQIDCMCQMWQKNQQRQWTCYNRLHER